MTNIVALLVLVSATGIVLVYGECQTNGGPIESCCCLGYSNTHFNIKSSGVYTIANFCGVKCSNTRAYCDTSTAGGGWLVVQRKQDGSVDFNRGWVDYEEGFGSLTGEFWYGLRPLHCLTNRGQWELRIDFTLTDGTKSYVSYSSFKVGPTSSNYQVTVSGFKGITSVSLMNNGSSFTTKDRDNDRYHLNCAVHAVGNAGGWWHRACGWLNINHQYKHSHGIYLNGWKALRYTAMKIRPVNCRI